MLTLHSQKILAKCSVLSGGISTTLAIEASLVAIGASEHSTRPVMIFSSYSIFLWSPGLSRCRGGKTLSFEVCSHCLLSRVAGITSLYVA